jgi:hypothetical protein
MIPFLENQSMVTKITALKMLVVAGGIGISVAALAFPKRAQADSERCTGMKQPVCATVEVCAGLPGNNACRTDYYYFPGAQ